MSALPQVSLIRPPASSDLPSLDTLLPSKKRRGDRKHSQGRSFMNRRELLFGRPLDGDASRLSGHPASAREEDAEIRADRRSRHRRPDRDELAHDALPCLSRLRHALRPRQELSRRSPRCWKATRWRRTASCWTLTLRDGLRFHDGEQVLARDAVASIKRWAARDAYGRTLFEATDESRRLDDAGCASG